jgi:hypothetical protein
MMDGEIDEPANASQLRSAHPFSTERKRSKADEAHQLVDLLSSCSLLLPNVERHIFSAPSESFSTGNAD